MSIFQQLLQQYWGYNAFRPLQLDIIESVAAGNDTLGLMPTGGGKSITFQVPALSREGLCLVITPLIALMKDQVENLRNKGIKAAALYAGMRTEELHSCLDNCIYGNYKFLYVSPERLATRLFQEKLPHLRISLITVDESHCISQWGYDFRPAYLHIADIRKQLPGVPVLALTATATPAVVADIQKQLHFRQPKVFQTSFARPNLAYVVQHTADKQAQVLRILQGVPGTSVVYVRNRKKTDQIAEWLRKNGITARPFHAGLPSERKDREQQAWKSGECRVMVATNAFGMGIDKPDVRSVIHWDLPDSPEAYFQEAGRAGRDGNKAYAVLLYDKSDATKLKKRIADSFPDKAFIGTCYEKLAYYLQVAMGDGEGRSFDFDILDFCSKFHLPLLPTHHALQLLSLSGYLEYTEEVETLTRVQIRAQRDQLYQLTLHPHSDTVLKGLLRSYTGLFADPVPVRETQLAQHCALSVEQVKAALADLAQQHIIYYIPSRCSPLVVYLRNREACERIAIPKSVYEERRKRYEERITAMLGYAQNREECRCRYLLRYFGETKSHDCGVCDYCLQHKRPSATPAPLPAQIQNCLRQEPLTTEALLQKIGGSHERMLHCLRDMLDSGQVCKRADNTLSLCNEL